MRNSKWAPLSLFSSNVQEDRIFPQAIAPTAAFSELRPQPPQLRLSVPARARRARTRRVRVPTCKLPCHHVVLLAKRDPVSVEQVNLLRIEGEADHFSDAHAAWPP